MVKGTVEYKRDGDNHYIEYQMYGQHIEHKNGWSSFVLTPELAAKFTDASVKALRDYKIRNRSHRFES